MSNLNFLAVAFALLLAPVSQAQEATQTVQSGSIPEGTATPYPDKEPIIPPPGCGPEDVPADKRMESLPNSEGETLIWFYRKDIAAPSIALRTKDGELHFFYARYKRPFVTKEIDQMIWLSNDEFVCVRSEQNYSLCIFCEMTLPDNGDEPNTRLTWTLSRVEFPFHVEWKLNHGKLEAWARGKRYMTLCPTDSWNRSLQQHVVIF